MAIESPTRRNRTRGWEETWTNLFGILVQCPENLAQSDWLHKSDGWEADVSKNCGSQPFICLVAVVVQHKKLGVHSNWLMPNLPNVFWNVKQKQLMEQNHWILAVSSRIACFFAVFCVHRKVRAVVSKYVCSFLPPTLIRLGRLPAPPKTWNHHEPSSLVFQEPGWEKKHRLDDYVQPHRFAYESVFFEFLILGERHNGWVSTKQPRILQSWAMIGNRITITIHNWSYFATSPPPSLSWQIQIYRDLLLQM